MESGEDINSLLSTRVNKPNQPKYADLLRSEWGIYHLHFKEDGSNEMLFVHFKDEDAYLLDILIHENSNGSIVTWTNTDLIQIMHDNWPHVIQPYIFNNKSDSPILSVEQRRALRKKAINTSVIVSDGTEYLPFGGGFSSSKHPCSAVIKHDVLLLKTKELQSTVEENYCDIKEALHKYASNPNIKLVLSDNLEPLVIESKTNIKINLVDRNA